MHRIPISLVLLGLFLGLLSLTGADQVDDKVSREKRDMPNWSYSASDFFAWVEQLRSHAGYEKMDELARTFWAHFPSAARLGYEQPHSDE
ncbi:otospiralin-like [Erpetoichthys calabaricus]|uniref:otospiralin-like n=1 Tax=Erpetoichthys calabaricus TaxID=27687 RepID=UPI0010A01E53|nr:otospiralin-like [Erpetoichthys calabaricus]